jgi:BirA family biotin operon repressor/biotin-[acetyl-CoA-carboxylase] ligase
MPRTASLRRALVAQLADGRFRDGDDLCQALQVSRRELWRALNALPAVGIEFEAAAGQGYRLCHPVELLDPDRIRDGVDAAVTPLLRGVEVLDEVDSTNTWLLDGMRRGLPAGHVCLAEHQSAGRGRRGRRWVSPYGRNLYLSLAWEMGDTAPVPSALGLACAVAVARALAAAGMSGVGLKWPNDILWRGCKLGGVLLELADAQGTPRRGVAGVGLNVHMPAHAGGDIGQPWADVQTALGRPVSRNALAALVVGHLLRAVDQYQAAGLAPFIEQWRQYDIMPGKTAVLRWPNGHVTGVVAGIDPHGELILSVDGVEHKYAYGEVSLRLVP